MQIVVDYEGIKKHFIPMVLLTIFFFFVIGVIAYDYNQNNEEEENRQRKKEQEISKRKKEEESRQEKKNQVPNKPENNINKNCNKKVINDDISYIQVKDRFIVTRKALELFSDVLVNYYKKGNDKKNKLLHVWVASYGIFIMNYYPEVLEKLDDKLSELFYGKKLYRSMFTYPQFKKYKHIQKAIANTMNNEIISDLNERQLSGNDRINRQIFYNYLETLFDNMEVKIEN